jgi:hypothetical protein
MLCNQGSASCATFKKVKKPYLNLKAKAVFIKQAVEIGSGGDAKLMD